MAFLSRHLLPCTALVLGACLAAPGAAVAAPGGKTYAKVGNWEIRKFPKYCAATIGFDGDRALRIAADSQGRSSFGFMGQGAAGFKKSRISFKFDNNPNTFTREAGLYTNAAEDGGAPWIFVADPANEPSHAGDWATAKRITFNYRIGTQSHSETFDLRGIDRAWEKTWACIQG